MPHGAANGTHTERATKVVQDDPRARVATVVRHAAVSLPAVVEILIVDVATEVDSFQAVFRDVDVGSQRGYGQLFREMRDRRPKGD